MTSSRRTPRLQFVHNKPGNDRVKVKKKPNVQCKRSTLSSIPTSSFCLFFPAAGNYFIKSDRLYKLFHSTEKIYNSEERENVEANPRLQRCKNEIWQVGTKPRGNRHLAKQNLFSSASCQPHGRNPSVPCCKNKVLVERETVLSSLPIYL